MLERVLCKWFGWHDWTFAIVYTRDGRSYSGRQCRVCGATQRAVFRSRIFAWEDVDEAEKEGI